MPYRALRPIADNACGRLSRKRSIWIKLDSKDEQYNDALVEALEWAIPKGHQLYGLFLDNPSLWKLPTPRETPEECHEVLREAIAIAIQPQVLAWMDENRAELPNIRLLK